MTTPGTTLENLTFDNRFTRELPCDLNTDNTRPTAWQCYAPPCGNFYAARPCSTWAYPPHVP